MDLSVVTSVYRDGYLVRDFCKEVARVLCRYFGVAEAALIDRMEIILVNDGSPDGSLAQLLAVQAEFNFVKVIDLSRNFGQHEALACGFRYAEGDYVARINVDMQDPPSELPKLLDLARDKDFDLVVGQYSDRKSPLINRMTAFAYFELFRFLTGMTVLQRTSPMRVMSRRFIDSYNALTEKTRFPQGLDCWLGFRQCYTEIEHKPRGQGKSSYNLWSRTKLALTGILYFSDRPLKLIGYFGLLMALLGAGLGFGIVVQKLVGVELLPGYTSLAAIILLGTGIQIGCLGVLGLYIGRIFGEVQNRPLYIVREIYSSSSLKEIV